MTREDVLEAFSVLDHVERAVCRRKELVGDVLDVTLRFDATQAERAAVLGRVVDAALDDYQTPAGVRRFETIDKWPG